MANEITTQISQSLANGELKDAVNFSYRTDQVTAQLAGGTQIVGFAAHELLDLGDVTSVGPSTIINLDATNFVEIGIDDTAVFVPIIQIPAGEAAVIQPATGVALYGKANTANVTIRRLIPSL